MIKRRRGCFIFLFLFVLFLNLILVSAYTINDSSQGIFTNITLNYSRVPHQDFIDSASLNMIDSNLIMYLPFDTQENSGNVTYDYSNHLNDGVLINGVNFNSSGGKYGGDYEFDGVNDYIKLNNLNFSDNESFTISAWINTKKASAIQTIFSTGAGGGAKGIGFLYSPTNRFYFEIYGESGGRQTFYSTTNSLNSGGWNYVAASFNATSLNLTLYANGVQNNSTIVTDPTSIVYAAPVSIGSLRGSSTYFNGSIDEVMLFNKTLNSTEISEIYDNQSQRFYKTGEIFYQGLNFSGASQVNITFSDCGSFLGSYIQGKINSGNYQNFSGCNLTNYAFSGNSTNANFTIKFNSDSYGFYSPVLIWNYTARRGVALNFSDTDFATQTNLTWPPANHSDSYSGAESNPTGNPIGGFVNYSRIVDSNDAAYYVNNESDFVTAIENSVSGDVIYINDSVVLDFTNYNTFVIPGNVTIASGRGKNYSEGALIKKEINDMRNFTDLTLFKTGGDNIRITGLRIYGGDTDSEDEYHAAFSAGRSDLTGKYYQVHQVSYGITSNASNLEIDNNELYGWRGATISSAGGALNNYVHHNYIHNNNHNGLGYGVNLGDYNNISFLIEANLFDYNRHSVASSYYNNSYEARYNIDLNSFRFASSFDRHGNYYGGNYTIIHHNTFYTDDGLCSTPQALIGIRGAPVSEDGGQIYNNWFECNFINKAIFTRYYNGSISIPPGDSGTNVTVYNNLVNSTTNSQFYFPVPVINVSKYTASINESISFNASGSYETGGSIRYVEWNFWDNTSVQYGSDVTHSFSEAGKYFVHARIFDNVGESRDYEIPITIEPENLSKNYLNFWMYENSFVDSPEYVQKQAIVNGNVLWRQNFSDNVSGWQHINVEIPSNLTDNENELNITLGVATLKNYTDPLYPSVHSIEEFEVFFDAVTVFKPGEDLNGDGDFQNGKWTYINNNGTDWTNIKTTRLKQDSTQLIAPVYRDNYTNGTFVGISKTVNLYNQTISSISMGGSSVLRDFADSGNIIKFNGNENDEFNKVVLPDGIFRYFNGEDNYVSKERMDYINDSFFMQFAVDDKQKVKPLIYLQDGTKKLYIYLNSENKLYINAEQNSNVVYSAHSTESIPSNQIDYLFIIHKNNGFSVYLGNSSLSMSSSGNYNLGFSNSSVFYLGKKDSSYFEGLIGTVKIYNYALGQSEINSEYSTESPYLVYTFNQNFDNSTFFDNENKFWTAGQFGTALNFDGSDDYVDFPDRVNVTGNKTILFRVKLNNLSSPQGILRFGITEGFVITVGTSGAISASVYDNNTGAKTTSDTLSIGKTYFVVIVKNSTAITQIYINNSENSVSTATTYHLTGADDTLGRSTGSPYTERYLNGSLEEVAIFNRSLNSTEISDIYQNNDINSTSGLLRYWSFRNLSVGVDDSAGFGLRGDLKNFDIHSLKLIKDDFNNNTVNSTFYLSSSYTEFQGKKTLRLENSSYIDIPLGNDGSILNSAFSLEFGLNMDYTPLSKKLLNFGFFDVRSDSSTGPINFVVSTNQNASTYLSNFPFTWDVQAPFGPNYFTLVHYEKNSTEFTPITFTKNNNILTSYYDGGYYSERLTSNDSTLDTSSIDNLTIGNFSGYLDYLILYKRDLGKEETYLKDRMNYLTCVDSDGDGYGSFMGFGKVNGCTYQQIDCDDSNANINPGESEVNGNSVDENCDGIIGSLSSQTSSSNSDDGKGRTKYLNLTGKDIKLGYSVNISNNQIIYFDFMGSEKKLEINNFDDKKILFTLDGVIYTLEIGNSINLDLNSDGVSDLQFTFYRVNNRKAEINLKLLNQKIPETNIEENQKPFWNFFTVLGLIIAGLILLYFVLFRKFGKKK